eukprot:9448099-Ditylum_brightwellii.AAC.1
MLECYNCEGNHYTNQCDQKKENKENKTKKDAHLHLTTSKVTSPHYDNTDHNFGEWGSVTLDGLMFHQTGKVNNMSYRDAILQPHKTPKRGGARIPGKWAAATEHLMQQTGARGKINPNWVLLDSQSTVNVFCNASLLANVRKARGSLDIYSTASKSTTDMIGDLPGFGTVWLYQEGIANILPLSKVAERFQVTYNSKNEEGFCVKKPNGSV